MCLSDVDDYSVNFGVQDQAIPKAHFSLACLFQPETEICGHYLGFLQNRLGLIKLKNSLLFLSVCTAF